MIVLDHVLIKGVDGREYTLSFHIPVPSISLIIAPSTIDLEELAKYILRYREPVAGRVIHDFRKAGEKYGLFTSTSILSSDEVRLLDVLEDLLEPGGITHVIKLVENLGVEIDRDTLLGDLPLSIRMLISILLVLAMNEGIYVFVEPFHGLDETVTSMLNAEFVSKKLGGETVVVLTTNKAVMDQLDFDYIVLISREGQVVEGDKSKFRQQEPWSRETIFEIVGVREYVEELAREPGFKGYIEVDVHTYWLFVDPRYLPHYISLFRRGVREGKVKRVRRVERRQVF